MKLLVLCVLLLTGCDMGTDPTLNRMTQVQGSVIWTYNDTDAGVRCYLGYQSLSCVKVK